MQTTIHNVTKIELIRAFVENNNSRTIRIVAKGYDDAEVEFELVMYGKTDALDALPKSEDFRNVTRDPVAKDIAA